MITDIKHPVIFTSMAARIKYLHYRQNKTNIS